MVVLPRARYDLDEVLRWCRNRLAGYTVPRSVTVVEPVDEHSGRVRVGDSEWSARGGPASAGDRVKVTSVEGNCLIVERGATLPPA